MKTTMPLAERLAELTPLSFVKVRHGDFLTINLDTDATMKSFRKLYADATKSRGCGMFGYTPSED